MGGITPQSSGVMQAFESDSTKGSDEQILDVEAIESEVKQALVQIEEKSQEGDERIANWVTQIDLHDSVSILRYGGAVQNESKRFASIALEDAIRRDFGRIGDLLEGVRKQLQQLSSCHNTVFAWISGRGKTVKTRYNQSSQELECIKRELEGQCLKLLVNIKHLDDIYQEILRYYGRLIQCIRVGERKLADARNGELIQLKDMAARTQTQEDLLCAQDFENKCDSFAERLSDLGLTKTISMQTALQIQLAQKVNRQIVLRIKDVTINSIVAWQQGIATALTVEQNQKALALHDSQLLATVTEALSLQTKGSEMRLSISDGHQQTC